MLNNVSVGLIVANVAYSVVYTLAVLVAETWAQYTRRYKDAKESRWYNRQLGHIFPISVTLGSLVLVLNAVRLYGNTDSTALLTALAIVSFWILLYAGFMYGAARCLALLFGHLWAPHIYSTGRQRFDVGVRLIALLLVICTLSVLALACNAWLVHPLSFLVS